WGKFRPWILWTAIPFGVFSILAFSTPGFGPTGKIIYALCTYILLVLIYSANNLPYSSLSGVLTGDMKERNSISSYRFVAVTLAQFIVQSILLPLVLILGDGDKAAGFEKVMLAFAIVGTFFFFVTFLTTKERILPPKEQKTSVKQDLLDLTKNKPWVMILIATVFIFITLALKGGIYIYYFENYVDNVALAAFLTNIGFNDFINGLNNMLIGMGMSGFEWPEDAASSAFSLFNASGIIMMIIAIAISKPLADKYGKRALFLFAITLAAAAQASFFFVGKENVAAVFILQIVHGFFYGLTIPLLWAMVADVADYSEWKNNRRATAIVFSAMLFGLKAGLAVGGSLVAGILSLYNYNPELAVQSDKAIQGVLMCMSIYPGLTFLVSIIALFFYEIDKKTEVMLEKELSARRANNQ
ncbi:MAG: MFS transporter, partial [Bacteroidota bacterium]|nr:MFS transporter [Bacteroidota bacterium]